MLVEQVEKGEYSRDEIMAMTRPYARMNKAEFEAELVSLSTRNEERLTDEQRFIVKRANHMRMVRSAMVELTVAESYLVSVSDGSLLRLDQFVHLDRLKATRIREGACTRMSFMEFVTGYLEQTTMAICGVPGLGKTPLARAVAASYARARNRPHFVQSSTVDSLRMLSVQGFFERHTAVVLDEWRIGQDSQDPNSHKVDFLKCLTDVQNPGTVRLRYSDVRFAADMPRIITTQQSPSDWLVSLEQCPLEDREAVLKRMVFVHVTEPLIPPSLVASLRGKQTDSLREAFEGIGLRPLDGKSRGWE